MATLKINWSFSAKVDGGPQLSESQPVIEITAYDFIKQILPAAVPPATTSTDVNLQTGTDPQMVVIIASKYTDKVEYAVDGGVAHHKLDGPHAFVGPGAVGFLGSSSPKKLTFINSSTDAITVQVLVGRPA